MKKNKITLLLLLVVSLTSCGNFHTGKVVIEDSKPVDEPINVEYIIVDESDKESLIDNIKSGKGAVVNRKKVSTQDSNDDDENNDNNGKNDSDR